MPSFITMPIESSYTEQVVELSGVKYNMSVTLNEAFEVPRLYVDLYLDDEPIILGQKVLANAVLSPPYTSEDFPDGYLFCFRFTNNKEAEATLGTVGSDLEFEIVYYTTDELESL
jgi:hypothetical protein